MKITWFNQGQINLNLFCLIAGLYGLVNNAGICVCGEFEWLTWKQIQRQVEVNLLGTMRVTKYCMPLLKSGQGKVFEFFKHCSYFNIVKILICSLVIINCIIFA